MPSTRGSDSWFGVWRTYSISRLFLLVLCLCLPVQAQAPELGDISVSVTSGSSIKVAWTFDTSSVPADHALLYFRPRTSQTPSGSYNVGPKIPAEARSYTLVVTHTIHLFISAWYAVTKDGAVTTIESPGSNHVKITVTP